MFTKATEYIDKVIKEKKLPLLDVIVYKDHEKIYERSGSYSGNFGKNELLCMFSCTKVFTAVAALRLVEEGKIGLEEPVYKYIPEFEKAYTLDENGEKHPEVITVRHLFTMSSGFDYKLVGPEILKLAKERYEDATTLDVILTLLDKPLHFTPGKRFLYSLSHDALGALIEKIEGVSLDEYMRRIIFEPLGMKNSSMKAADFVNDPPINHDILEDKSFKPESGNSYKHFHPVKNYSSGGAGLVSTTEDLAIFADTLAAGGKTKDGYSLLKPETIELMKKPYFHAVNVDNTYTCVQGTDYGYGLGVRVRTSPLECGIPVGEFGWDGAAGSYVLVDTDHGISVTMGLNIMNWPAAFRGEHLAIAKLFYEELI